MSAVTVRRASEDDLDALGELAGELVRLHHATDPDRFFLPAQVEQGYVGWLRRELGREAAAVLVAEQNGAIVGYAYGTLEGRDWNALLDEHGAIHDVLVAASARRGGVGRRLVDGLVAELESRGARRFVLHTMVTNLAAQRLFAACNFRSTMLEMTRSSGG